MSESLRSNVLAAIIQSPGRDTWQKSFQVSKKAGKKVKK
jgi:hypothetical protein